MFVPLLKGRRGVKEAYADKAYASRKNRRFLRRRCIGDKILRKAARNRPLSAADKRFNSIISAKRFKAEQQFGTKKLKFRFHRTRYFGLARVFGQAIFKAICCNLSKSKTSPNYRGFKQVSVCMN